MAHADYNCCKEKPVYIVMEEYRINGEPYSYEYLLAATSYRKAVEETLEFCKGMYREEAEIIVQPEEPDNKGDVVVLIIGTDDNLFYFHIIKDYLFE